MVSTQVSFTAYLWIASSDHPERAKQIISGSTRDDGHMGISWTSNNTIVYSSKEPGGDHQLWKIETDGTNPTRITSGKPSKFWPAVSPDGRYIVYNTVTHELLQTWRADMNGDNPKLLSGSRSMRFPRFMPDSKWILCSTSETKGNNELLKIAVDGTKEKTLATHPYILGGAISPDRKQIAYAFHNDPAATSLTINIINAEGEKPIKTFETDEYSVPNGRLHWTPDGRALAYIREEKGVGNVYVQPVDGSARFPLTRFTEKRMHNFSWSLDGKNIAFTRGTNTWDVVLIENMP
jgi:TolB protein